MSPGKSTKPLKVLSSRRAALNRAAYTLKELQDTIRQRDELTRKIPQLKREYYKLARRAALINNANMRSGPLQQTERERLRMTARITKNMMTASRTLKRIPQLAHINIRNKITRFMPVAGRT